MGVTPYGPVDANRGVRSGVRAARKTLEGDDRQTHKSIRIIERYRHSLQLTNTGVAGAANPTHLKERSQVK